MSGVSYMQRVQLKDKEKQNQSPHVLLPYLRKKLEELGIVY